MELHIGRFLRTDEAVHHNDGNKTNNSIYNLTLMTRSKHQHLHAVARVRKWNDPEVVARVLAAATNPNTKWSHLPESMDTIRRIRKRYGIECDRKVAYPAAATLTEELVREALRGRSTLAAAKFLGVHHMTLRNRFAHLLRKRASPNVLDEKMEDILRALEAHRTQAAVAREHNVNTATVLKAIQRWLKTGAISAERYALLHHKPGPIPGSRHTAPRTADTPPPHDADPQEC